MPLLFKYKCSYCGTREENNKIITGECDFIIEDDGGSCIYVKMGDKEKALPHPCEELLAKELTGKNLDELLKERRVFFKENRICLKCFKQEYECKCEKADFMEIKKIEGLRCPKCKEGIIEKIPAGIS
ncbi:hypothetical protein HY750_03355 [Candidatus Kuenenbacteria bacterium]|nr:hypothetical protein [Candidatus Kuenenbacteria bacterium]